MRRSEQKYKGIKPTPLRVASNDPNVDRNFEKWNPNHESGVLRFSKIFRKLETGFWDFSEFPKVLKKFRACGARFDVIFEENPCISPILPQNFRLRRKNDAKFTNFTQNSSIFFRAPRGVLRFFKIFEISRRGFKVLSLKFSNVGRGVLKFFACGAIWGRGVLTGGGV